MAVALEDLAPRLDATLNPPGGGGLFVATTEQYTASLANAFWYAKLWGLFAGYRANSSNEIVPVDGGDDLSEDLWQMIVLFAALTALEARIAGLLTYVRSKAGPVESEKRRSAEVLVQLLKAKRAELEDIRDDLAGADQTTVSFIDGVLARTNAIGAAEGSWWR